MHLLRGDNGMIYINNKNVHLALYNKDLIVLDKGKDDFYVFNDVADQLNENSNPVGEAVSSFLNSLYPESQINQVSFDTTSDYVEIRWLRPNIENKNKFMHVPYLPFIYLLLYSVKSTVDNHGFTGAEILLNQARKNKRLNNRLLRLIPEKTFIQSLNSCFVMFEIKNPCLIYSLMLAIYFSSRNKNSTLIVGVRTQPFFSHAWLEIDGEIFLEDTSLRNKLSVIMEI
ncbi:lasso peptide biosynthesis B2 protein [Salmonella enterica subsp. enterica]|nr:lasso peptide biosynthesis B2 protein [Salmonella enterica subsp. enterica serovar Panama]